MQAAEFEHVTADEWRRWETVVQAPFDAKTLHLTLRGFFGGSEWFYYDDLSVERVETLLWPAREATPNLHALTVTVPDIADVWTEALLRIPPASLVPVDGQLGSSVYTRGQDIRVQFQRPARVCWALVHSMRPEMSLGEARLVSVQTHATGDGTRRLLAESEPKEELVTSLRFEPTEVSEFVLEIPDDAENRINEIQLLGLSLDGGLPGQRVQMAIAEADPPAAVARDLALAFAATEHRASAVASPTTVASGKLALPAERYLNVFATPRKDAYGLASLSVDFALPGADEGDMIELTLRRPEELDVDVRWTTYQDRGISHRANRRNYATVVRAISRVEKGRLSVTFDVPDLVYAAGEPIWLTLRARREMTLDLAQSRLALNLLTPEQAYPEYVPQIERLMAASRYLDFWTAVNSVGRRQFKSYMFNTKQIWDDPPFDVDHPYCPLAMVAGGHLLWYTHSPKVAEIFLEEAESWAAGCLSTDGGKSAGAIPKEIRFRDSQVNPYAPYPTNPILQKRNTLYRGGAGAYIVEYFLRGAYALTGEDRFGRVLELWTPSDDRKITDAQRVLEQFTDSVDPEREGAWSARQNETTLYQAWQATGDRTWLVEELKEVVRQQIRNRWLLTEAEPYTDRIPLPGRELLSRMFLGDWTSGKSHVPGHWVSWEGGGLDYAALILDAKPDHLKALVHSFHEREQPMMMRVWRLPHGRYDLSIGIDRDGDERPDEQIRREEKRLWRYDGAVEFTARPGQTLVIELSLLEELDDVRTRPDLAIGPEDVTVEEGAVVLRVHNIGGSASPPSRIEVRDADSRVLYVAQAPALDPPHDLRPITAQVRIPIDPGAKPARIVLDPGDEIAEVTEANNEVQVLSGAGFTPEP